MEVIRNAEIERGTDQYGRVYLCGNLQYSRGVSHIKTNDYEIGVTYYSGYTFEKPHLHSFNREYNYVLEGQIKVVLLSKGKEYLFQKGDLFVIDINEPYVTKATAGSKTIFSKVPGGNDKVLVPLDASLQRWGEAWENEYREE